MVKFLLDQDVYGMTAKFLAEQNLGLFALPPEKVNSSLR